jgi:uncharacterized protein (TIGR02996 family)
MERSIGELEAHLRRSPDDRAAWLVYGDHLLGRGDARGELIGLPAAEREAFAANHLASWQAELPDGASVTEWCYGFARGLEVVWGDDAAATIAEALARPAARLVSALRILRRPPRGEDEDDLEDDDLLELEDEEGAFVGPEIDLAALAGVDLAQLATLDAGYLYGGDGIARGVAACTSLQGLTVLDLRYGAITDDGVAALAGARQLSGLRTLYLQRNRITAGGATALAGAEHLRELTVLDLRFNAIGEAGAAALAGATFAPRLSALHLYRDDITDEGAAALAGSARLPAPIRSMWKGNAR